jgi:competence protein CoiA
MKFAFVSGERREAERGLSGICIGCEQLMIPKCGPIKVKHWAHKSQCECDHWWENETEWHRSWKNNFPVECQEVRHKAEGGEWHIADVKTKEGYILEFQHSFLKPEERLARNNFYGNNLVWLVDGLKRKKDQLQFDLFLKNTNQINQNIQLFSLPAFLDECPLLKEWSECNGSVFFDFGSELPLWCLLPKSLQMTRYLVPYFRKNFVALHNDSLDGRSFSDLTKFLNDLIFAYENSHRQQNPALVVKRSIMQRQIAVPRNPSQRYLHHLNHSSRRRGRF